MARKLQSKSTLTDVERHARFVETAHDVAASDDPKDFEAAFDRVVREPISAGGTLKNEG